MFLKISLYSLHLETMLYMGNSNPNSETTCISEMTCPHKTGSGFDHCSWMAVTLQDILSASTAKENVLCWKFNFFGITWSDILKPNLVFLIQLCIKLTGKKNKIIVSSKKITFSAEKLKCFKNIHFLVTDILNFHSDLWKNSQRGNHLCLKSVSFWPTLHLNNVTKKIVQRWYSWLNPSAHKHFQCSEIKTTSVFT